MSYITSYALRVLHYISEEKASIAESLAIGFSFDILFKVLNEGIHIVSVVVSGLLTTYFVFKLNKYLEKKEKDKNEKIEKQKNEKLKKENGQSN